MDHRRASPNRAIIEIYGFDALAAQIHFEGRYFGVSSGISDVDEQTREGTGPGGNGRFCPGIHFCSLIAQPLKRTFSEVYGFIRAHRYWPDKILDLPAVWKFHESVVRVVSGDVTMEEIEAVAVFEIQLYYGVAVFNHTGVPRHVHVVRCEGNVDWQVSLSDEIRDGRQNRLHVRTTPPTWSLRGAHLNSST